MPLRYCQGDMLKLAPRTQILSHAVNSQGRWKSGIALKLVNYAYISFPTCKLRPLGRGS